MSYRTLTLTLTLALTLILTLARYLRSTTRDPHDPQSRALPDIVSSFPYDLALSFYEYHFIGPRSAGTGGGTSAQKQQARVTKVAYDELTS